MTSNPHRYALLIGVNHYDVPGNNLHAPVNDVRTWHSRLRSLGFHEDAVWVRTSPVADVGASARRGPATTAGVAEAVAQLLAAVADQPAAEVVLFFCGHANLRMKSWTSLDLQDVDPAIPSETGDPVVVHGRLHLGHFRQEVRKHATFLALVDGCRGLAPGIERDGVPLQDIFEADDGQLLVTATRLDEASYERQFQGVWRGLFTWSLSAVLDQWQAAGGYIPVTFPVVVERAATLIAAVSPPDEVQTPAVFASAKAKAMAAFHPLDGALVPVRAEPDPAPGHEWGAGMTGIIGTNVGWFQVGLNPTVLTLTFTSVNAPASPANLVFDGAIGRSILIVGAQSVFKTAGATTTNWAQVTLPLTSNNGNTYAATTPNLYLNISNTPDNSTAVWTWYQYAPANTPPGPLSGNLTFVATKTTPFPLNPPPAGMVLYVIQDTLTRQ